MDVNANQPLGTPTWIVLGVPDLDRALNFYGVVFGWAFAGGPEEYGGFTLCLLRGRPVAAVSPSQEPSAPSAWLVHLATPDCDATVDRARRVGGTVVEEPADVLDQGRTALLRDPAGATFGLWQGRRHVGCQVVNEPGALVRNDLVTPTPEPARHFYAAVFDFTLDRNEDMPGFDFTFLRRPDGHEVGGIMGDPSAPASAWNTTFEVAGTDDVVRRAVDVGGTSPGAEDFLYGRMATITDPFGAEFSVITRPAE
jgi:predicted enzyme related to lactoylglutathione lyase